MKFYLRRFGSDDGARKEVVVKSISCDPDDSVYLSIDNECVQLSSIEAYAVSAALRAASDESRDLSTGGA